MFYRDSHFEISIYISYSLLVVVDKIKKNFLVALVKKNIVRPGILFYWKSGSVVGVAEDAEVASGGQGYITVW